MENLTYLNNANGAFVDDLYQKYQDSPSSVDPSWRRFFEGYELGASRLDSGEGSVSSKEVSVVKLINAYRARGHLLAKTNPVRERRRHKADLELSYFGLSEADMDTVFEAGNELKIGPASLRVILNHLTTTYCGHIGVEFHYCRDEQLRQWLYNTMEPIQNRPNYTKAQKKHILNKISQAVTFENFLQKKYVGKKRFSLEGIESLIPSLDMAINTSADLGCREVVLGMAHRGRLNVLVNIFGKTYENVFAEFEGASLPEEYQAGGDVKYHLGQSSDIETQNGHKMHLSLVPNPSHLETVNPVVQGIVYAKRLELYNNEYDTILPILIHGDAAFSGQGVNYEVSNISKVDGYGNGGTLHIILNNQVGFTANYKEGRSSVYCTDLAKVTESPVFHVNADDPEAVVWAMDMAVQIRQRFNIDVYVDILGYRRYGHNEGDEPRFTQPILYKSISNHPDILSIFVDRLVSNQDITKDEAETFTKEFNEHLQETLDKVRRSKQNISPQMLQGSWKGLRRAEPSDFNESVSTKVSKKNLDAVLNALVTVPESFNVFSKMQKLLDARQKMYDTNAIDWGLAELLAYGSLLQEGHAVRISGQDCQRGTFSHRHAVIKDVETEDLYTPLNHISDDQKELSVYNSTLSEYCVLGFDYGYSIARPNTLVIWEAQFGDFSNGAQIIIDQYLSAAEQKWQRLSGLVMLLPHGYEGQGPEHSSARPERYLQLCAENNLYVCNVTTPSNFFHMIRRQIQNPFRKPLIVFTPKSLLRHPKVISPVKAFTSGGFQEIFDDPNVSAKDVSMVLCCTGKIYYELLEKQLEDGLKDVAIVRLEQLYPLSAPQLDALRKKYKHVKEWRWVQEEPENMGYWSHVMRHLPEFKFKVVSRIASASPATGSAYHHDKTQSEVIKNAFKR